MGGDGDNIGRVEGVLGLRAYTLASNVPVPQSLQGVVIAQKAVSGPTNVGVRLKAAVIPHFVIGVRFTSRMRVVHPDTQRVVECRQGGTVAGIQHSHLIYDQEGGFESLVLNLDPLSARRIVGVPSEELTGRRIEFDELWGGPAARELLDRLAEMRQRRGMLACFPIIHALLVSRLASIDGGRESALVAAACRTIRLREGRLSIKELVQELGHSHRYVIKCFRDQLGVTPNFFARLIRLDAATRRIGTGLPLAAVAADAGYADQAHMTREFAKLNGVCPSMVQGEGNPVEFDFSGRNWIFSARTAPGRRL